MKIKAPDYLLCENPIKDGSFEGLRSFIYVPSKLSLIEIFSIDDGRPILQSDAIFKEYTYVNSTRRSENHILVFVQNNCHYMEANPYNLLEDVWLWYVKYLEWEDKNINDTNRARDN